MSATRKAPGPLPARRGRPLPAVRGIAARNLLVEENLKLVGWMVNTFLTNPWLRSRLTNDDAMQAGYLGLIRAAELYQPEIERGGKKIAIRFSTYVYYWVRQALDREAWHSSLIHIPAHLYRKERKSEARLARLVARAALASRPPQSLSSEMVFEELRAPAPEPEEWGDVDNLRLAKALRFLQPREQKILEWRFWAGDTLEDIGARLGVSRERVRQILTRALDKLRRVLAKGEGE